MTDKPAGGLNLTEEERLMVLGIFKSAILEVFPYATIIDEDRFCRPRDTERTIIKPDAQGKTDQIIPGSEHEGIRRRRKGR